MRVILLLFAFFISCKNDPEVVKEFLPLEDNIPIETIKQSEILHTENGKLRVKIIASTIKRYNFQPSLVFSDGIQVFFYNDSSFIKSTLIANNAEVNETKKIMKASDEVILISSEGKELKTSELIWDEQRNMIYSDKKVEVITNKEVIKGEGFVSTPDFSKYSISKIHGTFNFNTINK